MKAAFALVPLTLSALLIGCGGGGSTSPTPIASQSATTAPTTMPTTTPTPAPTATPTSAPTSGSLNTATLNGSAGFVNASGRTVYTFDSDPNGVTTCTGACASSWPFVAPAAGVTYAAPYSVITRPDGSGMQLAFNSRPLYTFAGDSAAGQASGDGLVEFGGTWHVARPTTMALSSTPTSAPSPTATSTPYNYGY
jgi:predicted lipoprotein with Yx(FWY)xxD motif